MTIGCVQHWLRSPLAALINWRVREHWLHEIFLEIRQVSEGCGVSLSIFFVVLIINCMMAEVKLSQLSQVAGEVSPAPPPATVKLFQRYVGWGITMGLGSTNFFQIPRI